MNRWAWLPGFALWASPFAVMAQEVPAALKGLRYQREEAVRWHLRFEGEDQGKWMTWIIGMNADGTKFGNKNNPKPWLAPGDIFFKEGPMAGRFKFIGFDSKQIKNPRTGIEQWMTVAQYEDLKPNKKGWRYESQSGLPEADIVPNSDRTAVFTLKPEGQAETAEFKLEEFSIFAMPPGAPTKDFFLKEVGSGKVVVEYRDQAGAVRSVTILKEAKKQAESPAYKAIVIPKNAEAIATLTRIEKVVMMPKGVKDMELSDAVRQLNRPGEAEAVINLVIRKPRRGGGFDDAPVPAEPDKVPKVSLPETPLSFAAAIDSVCAQAGYRWEIEADEEIPMLVLEPVAK